MFFYFAKLFWLLVQPLNLSIVLLALAFVFGLLGRRRLMGTGMTAAILVLVLSAWTSLGAMMMGPLEERFARPDPAPSHVDGIVLLGGGLEGAVNLARGGYDLNRAGDRFVETAVLALRYPEAKIVVSGGNGALVLQGEGDADTATRLLTALGVARERLILENRSRDTYENALFTKEMVTPKPGETWLLVTSASHMPRSMGLFRKVGFPVLPWPTDYRTSGREGVGFFRDNTSDALDNTTGGLREWIGLFAYWLSGRIDSPFPGPD